MKKAKKRKPGRPVSNLRVRQLMKLHRCSRQWAYELWRREKAIKVDLRIDHL